eukprot:s1215_g7.t1
MAVAPAAFDPWRNHRRNAAAACTEPAVVEHLPDEFFKKINEKSMFPVVSCSPEKACCNLWHLKIYQEPRPCDRHRNPI